MMKKTLLILPLLIFLLSCQEKNYVERDVILTRTDTARAAIPYENIKGLIVVDLVINKSNPLKFILDTGAPKTFVFPSERTKGYDEPLSDSVSKETHKERVRGGSVKFSDGLQLAIGNVILKNLSVGEWPSKMFFNSSSYDEVPYDGIIGYDLLHLVTVEINRKDRIISLHDQNTYLIPKDWRSENIELEEKKPYIMVDVRIGPEDEPIPLRLHLDLGNQGPMWVKTDREKRLQVPEENEQIIGQWLNGKPQVGTLWPVHELTLFDSHLWGVPTRFVSSGHPYAPERVGHLGAMELRYFDLIIDYKNKKVAAYQVNDFLFLSANALDLYSGKFSSKSLPLKITLEEKGGLLYLHPEGQNSLPLTVRDEFTFSFEPMKLQVIFFENEVGKVDYNSFTLIENGNTFPYKRD